MRVARQTRERRFVLARIAADLAGTADDAIATGAREADARIEAADARRIGN